MARLELWALVFFVILALLPFLLPSLGVEWPYWGRVLSSALMLSSLALAQNVLLGFTGYPAFGGVAFFGIGGYTTALLMKKLSLPFLPALLLGGALGGLSALILAPALMRLKSHYFAIATLAFQLALRELVSNLEFTGGESGINLPIYRGPLEGSIFYLLFLLLTVISFGINLWIDRSVFGYALKAIREDEVAARSVGINAVLFKSLSFGIASSLTGLVGGLYAYWITYIDPSSMFSPLLSVKTFVALLLGGVGTTVGPILGAFLLEMLSELVWSNFTEVHGMVLGLLVILVILFLPGGILLRR